MTSIIKSFEKMIRQRSWLTFSVLSAAFAWLVASLLLLSLSGLISPSSVRPERSTAMVILGGVILAPLLENLLVVVALALLGQRFSPSVSTYLMTGIAVCLHAAFASWSAVAALVLFAVMGASYQAWHSRGARTAFLVIFLQHALFNLPATAVAAMQAFASA